jgi:hypothetical protein
MKTPCLLASLAVAATTSAADPKDPTAVAQEWKENTAVAQGPLTSDLGLRAQAAPPPVPTWPVFVSDCWPAAKPPAEMPRRSERLYDAPGYRVPKNLPNDRPRGAIPWNYDGQVYWLIPLTPPAGK